MKNLILVALTVFLLAGESLSQQTLDIDITQVHIDQFPQVRLHIQVRRQGAVPVNLADLTALVSENGIPQQIESLTCPDDGSIRLSIAVLLDRSRSMAIIPGTNNTPDPDSTKHRAAKAAISKFLDLLTPRDEAAIFGFTTDLSAFNNHVFTVEEDFTTDIGELQGSLVPIATLGGTRIWQAIIDAVRLLRVRSGRKALILVTDGRNTLGNGFRAQAVAEAVSAAIPVYSIGIGTDVDVAELTALSSSTGGRFFNSPTSDGLQAFFNLIADELITDECVLKYQSTNPCADGGTRIVDLQVLGNTLVAEDDTSFTLPDRRDTIMLSPDLPTTALSRNVLRVPILSASILSTTTPVTYTLKITYDNTLMRWLRFDTDATVSQGLPVSISETTPGVLSVNMPGGTPVIATGALFVLEFDVFPRSDERRSVIDISEAGFSTGCPSVVLMTSDDVTLLPCEETYAVSSGDRVIVSGGDVFALPLLISPQPETGDRMTYRGRISYDPSIMRYGSISLAGGLLDGSALVTGGDGNIDVTVDGVVKNAVPLFATLRFTAKADKQPKFGEVRFETQEFTSLCKVTSDWTPASVLVDGICEPVVRRKATLQMSNHPNPATDGTTITFSVPSDGMTRLRLLDSRGREVRQLLQASLPAGSYTHQFDTSTLPAGEYLGVLETGRGSVTRKILVLR